MKPFHAFVTTVNRWFLTASGAIILAVLAAVMWDIFSRNVLDEPTMWVLDISRFALVFIFFLALAPALESGAHVAVDILYDYLPRAPRRLLQGLAQVLAIAFTLILLWYVYQEAWEAVIDDGTFNSAVQVKMKYVYWIGPVGALQFVLTAVSLMLRGQPEAEPAQAQPQTRAEAV